MGQRHISFGLWCFEFLETAVQLWHELHFSRLDYAHDIWICSSSFQPTVFKAKGQQLPIKNICAISLGISHFKNGGQV